MPYFQQFGASVLPRAYYLKVGASVLICGTTVTNVNTEKKENQATGR